MKTAQRTRLGGLSALDIPLDLEPMEAKLVSDLPKDAGWQYKPKWDGFRCLAFRAGDEVEIKAKSGKSLLRFFPEVLQNLRALATKTFVLDGELVIPIEGGLSFEAAADAAAPGGEPDYPTFRRDPGNLHCVRLPAAQARPVAAAKAV